jgi:hypothetical protein
MKVHMLNGLGEDYPHHAEKGMGNYGEGADSLVGLGTSADTFPASVMPNPYAHGTVGMYSGTSTLVGLGKPLKQMTIEEAVDKIPVFLDIIKKNPQAAMDLFSAFGSLMTAEQEMQKHDDHLKYQVVDNKTGFVHGEISTVKEEEPVSAPIQLLPDTAKEPAPSPKMIVFGIKAGAKMGSKASNYKADGLTYENPNFEIEEIKVGRNPTYICLHTSMTSSNQPPVRKTIRIIDARNLDDKGLIMATTTSGTREDMLCHEFMNQVFLSYHATEKDIFDKLYYDKKYGWRL